MAPPISDPLRRGTCGRARGPEIRRTRCSEFKSPSNLEFLTTFTCEAVFEVQWDDVTGHAPGAERCDQMSHRQPPPRKGPCGLLRWLPACHLPSPGTEQVASSGGPLILGAGPVGLTKGFLAQTQPGCGPGPQTREDTLAGCSHVGATTCTATCAIVHTHLGPPWGSLGP